MSRRRSGVGGRRWPFRLIIIPQLGRFLNLRRWLDAWRCLGEQLGDRDELVALSRELLEEWFQDAVLLLPLCRRTIELA